MRKTVLIFPSILLAAACSGAPGFEASGSVQATITDPSASTPTETGFGLAQQTEIDPSLPSGATTGYTGTCDIGSSGRTLRITAIGASQYGLSEIDVSMPDWSQDSCTNCQYGSITATVGTTPFTGAENRSNGTTTGACTFNATANGSSGMTLGIQCNGMTATDDPRTLAVTANLSLQNCGT